MRYLFELSFLGAAFFGLVPGFSGMFLIEAAIALVLVGATTTITNSKGLLPGTTPYKNRIAVQNAQTSLELDRINRTRTRLKLLESEDVDRILALGPGKEGNEQE